MMKLNKKNPLSVVRAWHQQDHRDVADMLLIGSTEMLWAGY